MPFQNIRPLHILWQENIEREMLSGVFFGIARVLLLAGVFQQIKLEHLGKRRQPNYFDQNRRLLPYQSIDWHIWWASLNSQKAGHLNSLEFLNSLRSNPTYKIEPRYELVVVNEPLHWSDDSLRTVIGIGRQGQGTVITLNHHLPLLQPVSGENDEDRKKRKSDFLLGTQMLAMHELGHVFGLFSRRIGNTNPTDQELKEAHCLNECVMYWREDVELQKKIMHKPFCPSCLEKLKQFFIEP